MVTTFDCFSLLWPCGYFWWNNPQAKPNLFVCMFNRYLVSTHKETSPLSSQNDRRQENQNYRATIFIPFPCERLSKTNRRYQRTYINHITRLPIVLQNTSYAHITFPIQKPQYHILTVLSFYTVAFFFVLYQPPPPLSLSHNNLFPF